MKTGAGYVGYSGPHTEEVRLVSTEKVYKQRMSWASDHGPFICLKDGSLGLKPPSTSAH